MTSTEYLERLLPQYQTTFDLYRPYDIDGKVYPAYGYFCSHSEKYVLTKDAKLWEANSFEHILFLTSKSLKDETIEQGKKILEEHLEAVKVRKGAPYPEENHMYSYLTIVFISEGQISDPVISKIKKYKFIKNYKFTIRGYSEGRLIGVDLSQHKVWTNRAGKPMKKLYEKLFTT